MSSCARHRPDQRGEGSMRALHRRPVRGCFRDRTRRGDGGSRADGEELPEQADPPGGAVLGGRRRRHPRARREPEARRELGAVGGDREPNGRRRQAWRDALVAKSPPDGHTLLWTSSAFTISAALFPDLPVRSAQGLCRRLLHRNRHRRGSRVADARDPRRRRISSRTPRRGRGRFSSAPPAPAARPT